MRRKIAGAGLWIAAAAIAGSAAFADSAPSAEPFARYADPSSVVLAVRAEFPAAGGAVRLAVYDNDRSFLETAILKHKATVDDDGVAVMPLYGLQPGAYAFVAYYDANGDGRLNRGGLLGKPKEPVAFSNGVRPKLRRPHFDEAKVAVAPGSVVVLTLDQ